MGTLTQYKTKDDEKKVAAVYGGNAAWYQFNK